MEAQKNNTKVKLTATQVQLHQITNKVEATQEQQIPSIADVEPAPLALHGKDALLSEHLNTLATGTGFSERSGQVLLEQRIQVQKAQMGHEACESG